MLAAWRKKWIAWGALAAILLAGGTPAFALQRLLSQPDALGAICTLGGVQPAPAQPAVPADSGVSHQQHCVCCFGGAWQPTMDAAPQVRVPAAPGTPVFHAREGIRHSVAAALQPLGPRAPPRSA